MFNRNVVACIFSVVFLLVVVGGCEQKTDMSQTPTKPVSYTPPNYSDTDTMFVNGILNHSPGFLVTGPIKAQTKNDFAVGRKATFSDGTVRTIVKIEENTGNLIVHVDGAPLDGNVVGYPKEIKITAGAK